MPEDIVSGANTLYNTKIPAITDTANIQTALRLYHYGDGIDSTKSIVNHLTNLQNQITNATSPVSLALWSARGALVSATAAETLATVSLGTPGQVLTALSGGGGTGVGWQDPQVTLINSVTLSNKTLTNALIANAGIKFAAPPGNAFVSTLTTNTPTADRSITLPDANTELVGTNTTQTLTNKSIDVAQLSSTAQTASTARTTLQIFNSQTAATGGDDRTPYSGKIYVADPAIVGSAGANIDGAATGDLWFW